MRKRRIWCAHGALAALAGLAITAMPTAAHADFFLGGFQGHSTFINPNDRADGTVNFAVYQNDTGTWTGDAFFSGLDLTSLSGSVDATAKYVYLYQAVNTDPDTTDGSDAVLTDLFVSVTPAQITSYGVFGEIVSSSGANVTVQDTAVFVDSDGQVGPSTNRRLGNNAAPNDTSPDGSPSDSAATVDDIVVNNQAASVYSATFNPTPFGGDDALQFTFHLESETTATVGPRFTSLLFVTSNWIPSYGTVALQDGVHTAGDAPVPTPVPATLAMLLGGLPGFAGLGLVLHRRREGLVA